MKQQQRGRRLRGARKVRLPSCERRTRRLEDLCEAVSEKFGLIDGSLAAEKRLLKKDHKLKPAHLQSASKDQDPVAQIWCSVNPVSGQNLLCLSIIITQMLQVFRFS